MERLRGVEQEQRKTSESLSVHLAVCGEQNKQMLERQDMIKIRQNYLLYAVLGLALVTLLGPRDGILVFFKHFLG